MNITQIRNATQLITYAGKRFLNRPMLGPEGRLSGLPRHGARGDPQPDGRATR